MKTETELFENALDTTSVNGKKLREYINKNYISNSVLDKIKVEIERLHYHPKLDFIKNDEIVDMAIEIIDKYTAESEDKEKEHASNYRHF